MCARIHIETDILEVINDVVDALYNIIANEATSFRMFLLNIGGINVFEVPLVVSLLLESKLLLYLTTFCFIFFVP